MTAALPALPRPFTWSAGQIALELPGGHVLFTTRRPTAAGAVIDLLDPAAPVVLAALTGIPAARIAQSPQVHGAAVRVVAGAEAFGAPAPEADGQATARADVACVVRVADCLPIVLVAPEGVAALHAGWRGLAAGVLAEGVRALRALGACEIRAAVGPGARVCCYEAGPEVHAPFAHLGPRARSGTHADLAAAARAMLQADDVTEIHDTGLCTMCAPGELLWSHRRDGDRAGRQAGVVWRS